MQTVNLETVHHTSLGILNYLTSKDSTVGESLLGLILSVGRVANWPRPLTVEEEAKFVEDAAAYVDAYFPDSPTLVGNEEEADAAQLSLPTEKEIIN